MLFTGRILNIITAVTLFLTGGATIGISIWLWNSNSGGNFDNWTSVCEDYPGRYLRPFSLDVDGQDEPSYCGYSDENTTLRLSLGSFSIVYCVIYLFSVVDQYRTVFHSILLLLIMVWYSSAIVDSTSLANATVACNDSYGDINGVNCNSSSYGIMIAVTSVSSLLLSSLWYMQLVFNTKSGSMLQTPLHPTETPTVNPNFASSYFSDPHQEGGVVTNTPLPFATPNSEQGEGDYRPPSTVYA